MRIKSNSVRLMFVAVTAGVAIVACGANHVETKPQVVNSLGDASARPSEVKTFHKQAIVSASCPETYSHYGDLDYVKSDGSKAERRLGPHRGSDYPAHFGAPVTPFKSGKVVQTGNHQVFGERVVVRSGPFKGTFGDFYDFIVYGHLDGIFVESGQFVKRGQTILGPVGLTGLTVDPHLHAHVIRTWDKYGGYNIDDESRLFIASPKQRLDPDTLFDDVKGELNYTGLVPPFVEGITYRDEKHTSALPCTIRLK